MKRFAPQDLGENHYLRSSGDPFAFNERPAEEGLRAQHCEQVGRHPRSDHALRTVPRLQHADVLVISRRILQQLRLVAHIFVVKPRRRPETRLVSARPDKHQPVGVGIRQRTQQNAVYYRKDGRVRTHAQRQGQDRQQRHSRRVAQLPKGIAQVIHKVLHSK